MNKSIVIGSLAVGLISTGLGIGTAVYEYKNNNFIPNHMEYVEIDEQFDEEDYSDIVNVSLSGDYKYEIVKGSDSYFHFSGRGYKNKSHELTYTVEDDTLVIEFKSSKQWYQEFEFLGIDFLYESLELKVTLPSSFLGVINVNTVNHNVDISEVNATDIGVKNVNGSINLSKVNATNITVKNVNGGISLDTVNATSIDSTSTNGKTSIEGTFTHVKVHSVNGGVSVSLNDFPSTLDINTVNGSVNLNLDKEFEIYLETVVGHMSVDNNVTQTDDKNSNYKIVTVTGSININQ